MLDTGNLYNLLTAEIPEWTSQTWEIDWDNNRLLSKRINGKEAIAQAATVILAVDHLKHPIFSDRFGSELYQYIGKDRDLLKCNAERLVKEALSPDLRILKIKNFQIEDINKNCINLIFTIECDEGLIDMEWEVLLE